MELTRQADRQLVHLVNYRVDRPFTEVNVQVRAPAKTVTSVRIAAPEATADQPVPFTQQAGSVSFRVPRVNVYAIAIVE